MKSNSAGTNKIILYYGLAAMKKEALTTLCRDRGILLKEIGREELDHSLGSLIGLKGLPVRGGSLDQTGPGPLFGQQELLVFSGMDSQELDLFLGAYKAAGIPPVSLKAILTPYNITWTPHMLMGELNKERSFLRS